MDLCLQRGEIDRRPLSSQEAPDEIWHAGGRKQERLLGGCTGCILAVRRRHIQ